MSHNGWKRGLIIGLLLALLMAGCGGRSEARDAAGGPEGTITISGAWALYPMVVQWADEFQALYPNVEFDISAGGAGKGMADVLGDAVDIGMVSRRIYPDEEAKGALWVSVAKDAVIKDPLGIGYNNLNYAYDQETGKPVAGALVLPLDINENGRVDENERFETKEQAVRSVAEAIYPSPPARDLNLVTRGQPAGLTRLFLAWILSDGQQFVDQAGYVALPAEKIQAEMEKLAPEG